MGCGSSVGQVADSKQSIFKLQQILVLNSHKQDNIANGKLFLFGQTRTHRKIIECEAKLNTVKLISNKTRIPCPKINLDPLQTMYQESQEIFHLGIYGFSTLPPFNKMLALYLQTNIIFVCGGRDYDHYNVRNQVFFYSVQDVKATSEMISNTNELSQRIAPKSKYSRNRFQKMSSMSQKRYCHMGIYSNKLKCVLVFGGINEKDEIIASSEIYSILQNTWKDLPSMKQPRANGHCFGYAGKVYLFGGRSNQGKLSKKIQVLSLDQLSWSVLQFKIHRGIQNFMIFSQNPNEVLVVGGKSNFYSSRSVIKIELKEGTYVWHSELNKEYAHAKGIKMNEDLLVFGGQKDTCQIFNRKKWRKGLFSHRKTVQLQELQDFSFTQQSLVIKTSENSPSVYKNCLDEQNIFFGSDDYPCIVFLNKQTGKIQKRAVPMTLRLKKNMQILELPNKKIMLLGGSDRQEKKVSRNCFLYDAQTNIAKQLPKMSEKKINFAVINYKNQIYTFGGYNPLLNVGYIICQKYNQQKWTNLCKLNKPYYKTYAQIIGNDKIAVFGKQFKNSPVQHIQIYNTKRDQYDSYALKDEIVQRISMVYSVEDGHKIIILKQGKDDNLQEIVITEKKLTLQDNIKQQLKTIQYKNQSLMITHKNKQSEQKFQVIQSQKLKTEEQQPKQQTNIIIVKPKMIQVKPLVYEDYEETIKQYRQENSIIQKKLLQNQPAIQFTSDHKLNFVENQMSQVPLEDEVSLSIEDHSLQANLTNLANLKFQKRNIQLHKNSLTQQPSIQEKTEKIRAINQIKSLKTISKEKQNIIKRQSQLYFFSQSEVVIFDKKNGQKTTHKLQPGLLLKLSEMG